VVVEETKVAELEAQREEQRLQATIRKPADAKAAPAPILFVRRGTRPGALAPRTGDLQKFAWSRA